MTTLVAVTILLTPAAATHTAGATSPVERDYKASWQYAHQAAKKYRTQRDNLQQRLTQRVLQVRDLTRRLQHIRRIKTPTRDVAYAIRLAATAYNVSETDMHRVASCESGHYAYAQNGQYRGVFQEGPMFEGGPYGRAGFSVWDPVANAMTAAETVAREGWQQWSCRP